MNGLNIQKLCQEFLAEYPDVNSVGIGYPTIAGVLRDDLEPHLIVGVSKKGALQGKRIPQSWRGVTTDVIQSNPAIKPPGLENTLARPWFQGQLAYDYIAPGVAIGPKDENWSGTCGMVVWDKDTGKPHIITNDHVVPGKIGTLVTHPGGNFAGEKKVVGTKVGGSKNGMDVALIKIEDEFPHHNIPLSLDTPINGHVSPSIGMIVHKVGVTTGYTTGKIVGLDILQMRYNDGRTDYIWAGKVVPLDEQNPQNIEISEPGDSGSVWFDDQGRAVLLHFAGEGNPAPEAERAFGCPLDNIFRILGLTAENPAPKNGLNQLAVKALCDDIISKSHKLRQFADNLTQQADAILRQIK